MKRTLATLGIGLGVIILLLLGLGLYFGGDVLGLALIVIIAIAIFLGVFFAGSHYSASLINRGVEIGAGHRRDDSQMMNMIGGVLREGARGYREAQQEARREGDRRPPAIPFYQGFLESGDTESRGGRFVIDNLEPDDEEFDQ